MKFKSTALQEEPQLSPRPGEWLCSSLVRQARQRSCTTLTFYFINYSYSKTSFSWYLLLFYLTYSCRLDSSVYVSTFISLTKMLHCNFLQPYSSVNHIRYSYAYLQQQYTRGTILLLFIAVVCLSSKTCKSFSSRIKYILKVLFHF